MLDHDRAEVGVDAEHARKADRPHAQRQPDLPAAQGAELAQRAGARVGPLHGREPGQQPRRGRRQRRHHRKGPAPAESLAQRVGQRHAHDGGDGEPQQHPRHRLPPPVRRGQRSRHQRRRAQIGPVRKPGDKARGDEGRVALDQPREPVGEREQRHQPHQDRAPGDARGQHRDHRRADAHAQRIGADRVAGLGLADAEVGREEGDEAHRGELGDADREPAKGEREHHQAAALDAGGDLGLGGHGATFRAAAQGGGRRRGNGCGRSGRDSRARPRRLAQSASAKPLVHVTNASWRAGPPCECCMAASSGPRGRSRPAARGASAPAGPARGAPVFARLAGGPQPRTACPPALTAARRLSPREACRRRARPAAGRRRWRRPCPAR